MASGKGVLISRFPKPQARSPHSFEKPYGLHDPIKANRGSSRASPHIASQVFVGRCVDAEPRANQIIDGFGLKLANGKR